ncbi:MAG: dTMP kinase [Terriglobales bacterium]
MSAQLPFRPPPQPPSGPTKDAAQRPLLISFSGLDGSGKSTQIENLCSVLEELGYRTVRLAFWDDVVVLTRYREGFVHNVFGSEQGIGAPGKPVRRRDKNMRGWYLTLARHVLYFLDTINLRRVIGRVRRNHNGAIVIDRYIYDELANLPLHNFCSRAFVHLMNGLAPQPDIAYLLDADPDEACARKPEYPVEFMRQCRGWYHNLAGLLGTMIVIPPEPLEDARRRVTKVLLTFLQIRDDPTQAGEPWRKTA